MLPLLPLLFFAVPTLIAAAVESALAARDTIDRIQGSIDAAITTDTTVVDVTASSLPSTDSPAAHANLQPEATRVLAMLEAGYQRLASVTDTIAAERAEVAALIRSHSLTRGQLTRYYDANSAELEVEKQAVATLLKDEVVIEGEIASDRVGMIDVDPTRLAKVSAANAKLLEMLTEYYCPPPDGMPRVGRFQVSHT